MGKVFIVVSLIVVSDNDEFHGNALVVSCIIDFVCNMVY